MTTITKAQRRAAAQQESQRRRQEQEHARQREEIDRLIEASGWAVCLMTMPSGAEFRHFGYTIGLTDRGLPELCAQGSNAEAVRDLLNGLPHIMRASGVPAEHGTAFPLPGTPAFVALRRVTPGMLERMQHARERYTFIRALMAGIVT